MPTENSGSNSESAKSLIPHRFQPGQSVNPGGRPKKHPVTDHLRRQLDWRIPESMKAKLPPYFEELFGVEVTFAQLIAFKMILEATSGNLRAMREVLDRVEGKVNQQTSVEGSSDIVLRVLRADL